MSYKFQFGPARLSGSTLYKNGLDISGSFTIEDPTSLAGDGLVRNGTTLDLHIADMSTGMTGDLADTDEFAISDAGTMKKVDFSVVRDAVFTDISSDATVAAGGALTIAADAVTNAKLANIARGSVKVGGVANAPIDLDAKTSGQILVGDGTDVVSVAVSGDATLAANGALTIAADAVTNAKLANIARGSIKVGGASDAPTDLDAKTSGQILVGDGTDLASVAVSGDATLAANGAVTLAAAQTNVTSLLAANIKIGEDNQTKIDFETADEIHFYAANAEQVFVSDGVFGPESDSDVDLGASGVRFKDAYVDSVQARGAVNGLHLSASHGLSGSALTLGGVAVTATSAELNLLDNITRGSILVGGSGGSAELAAKTSGQMLVGDGTDVVSVAVSGDIGLAANGAMTIQAGAVEEGMLNDNVISGQDELAAADIADADEMLISDGGTLKRVGLDSLSTYFGGGAPNKVGNADAALLEGFNYATASVSANRTYTLPASSGLNLGDKVIVKVGQVGPGVAAVVTRAGSQTIDQTETSIRLEEDGAAVTLIYGEADKWFIV